jgi:hypothetical protein
MGRQSGREGLTPSSAFDFVVLSWALGIRAPPSLSSTIAMVIPSDRVVSSQTGSRSVAVLDVARNHVLIRFRSSCAGPPRLVAGEAAAGAGPDVASKPRTGANGRDPGPVKPMTIDLADGSTGPDSWPNLIHVARRKHRESAQLKKHYDDILMLVKDAGRSKGIWTRLYRWTERPCSIGSRDARFWGLCFAVDTMAVAEACNFSAPSFSEAFLAVRQDESALKDDASIQQCLSTLRRQDAKSGENGA